MSLDDQASAGAAALRRGAPLEPFVNALDDDTLLAIALAAFARPDVLRRFTEKLSPAVASRMLPAVLSRAGSTGPTAVRPRPQAQARRSPLEDMRELLTERAVGRERMRTAPRCSAAATCEADGHYMVRDESLGEHRGPYCREHADAAVSVLRDFARRPSIESPPT